MNKYQSDQIWIANLLASILKARWPTVNPVAIDIIAKNAVVSADVSAMFYAAQTHTGAMHGEAMATIVVTDALCMDMECMETKL